MAYAKVFGDTEFERRRSEVGRRMEDAGFDLLVCQDPANMNWLTGFDGWSFYTPQAVLVHRDEEFPIWFGRAQDARSATITTDLPAGNIVAFSESLVHHPTSHPFDELCELIRQRGWGHVHESASTSIPTTTPPERTDISSPDSRMRPSPTTASWSTGRVWSSRRPSSPTCAKPAPSPPA